MTKRSRSAKKTLEKRAKVKSDQDDKLFSSWSSFNDADESQDEIEDYELKPRQFKADPNDDEKDFERLPIKSSDGKIHRVVTSDPTLKKQDIKHKKKDDEEEEQEDEKEEQEEDNEEQEQQKQIPQISEREELLKAQEKIAEVAELVTEDPEENIGLLRDLRDIIDKAQYPKVKQITILSLVPIFKGLIPGYRIRPLTELEKNAKATKEVKRLRNFEETLVSQYRDYVDLLSVLSRKGSKTHAPRNDSNPEYMLGGAALRAACEMLLAAAHFNFRTKLIEIVVDKLSRKQDATLDGKSFAQAVKTIQEVFKADEEGHVSNEVVRLLSKMIKARKFKVHEVIIETLLYLRLLTELGGVVKAGLNGIEKDDDDAPKIKKKDRVHLSKRERKIRKENKAIEEEIRKTEATISAQERERIQSETLKTVFVIYFNILKERVAAPLMAVTLEGLAKFAHLINAEFFGDLLEVLRELILERQTWDINGELKFKESTTREALLCIVTAFALLSGQSSKNVGESMNLDLTFFINHFYSSLYAIGLNPDVEYAAGKTLRLEDPLLLKKVRQDDDCEYLPKKVNVATEMEMVVKSFDFVFFKNRAANTLRAEAFAKRLMISGLHMPEKSSLAALKTLAKMTRRYAVLGGLYSTEDRITNGVFRMDIDEPEHSNPEAATLWETVLLEKHYCPKVAKAASLVPKVSLGISK
ncbi:uncharacterized protein SAPINGB_P004311 [Magnusiomyces paraingens]|uniref:Nucleolar complex-associated protein 3 n=1 Tax=Magnusiomyces paraingens TaxID=2606893 RepID=A0A5E8C1A3_9ASCO|nr:uncharacterized protein SAPINGB_P004311 [Saprochaete ingens]VVT54885.1 unnamed protein product [Saprochaete ingens]